MRFQPRPRELSWHLISLGLVVTLGFSAIATAILLDMARRDREKAFDAATNLVTTIGSEISRNIELYDLSLQAVVDGLKVPNIDKITPDSGTGFPEVVQPVQPGRRIYPSKCDAGQHLLPGRLGNGPSFNMQHLRFTRPTDNRCLHLSQQNSRDNSVRRAWS